MSLTAQPKPKRKQISKAEKERKALEEKRIALVHTIDEWAEKFNLLSKKNGIGFYSRSSDGKFEINAFRAKNWENKSYQLHVSVEIVNEEIKASITSTGGFGKDLPEGTPQEVYDKTQEIVNAILYRPKSQVA